MTCIIFQQGSGSRILAKHLGGFVDSFFEEEPTPDKAQAAKFLEFLPNFRLAYNHLEEQDWLYEMLQDYKIIHLYRDPGRTFTRQMAKYKEKECWTRKDLAEHIKFVREMRGKVNAHFNDVEIIHYEDFIKEYKGEKREFDHLGDLL